MLPYVYHTRLSQHTHRREQHHYLYNSESKNLAVFDGTRVKRIIFKCVTEFSLGMPADQL